MKVSRMLYGPLLLLFGAVLAGCAGSPSFRDPTGVAFLDRLLAFLANPNVAYLLLVLGLLALIAEFTTPGAVAPGVSGVILLILALYGLLQLPTNWLGPVLMITGVVMLLLDIKVTGFALSVGGVIAFLLGSFIIFPPPWAVTPGAVAPVSKLNPWLAVATTTGVALFFIFGITAALKAQRRPVAVGRETLIGQTGVTHEALTPRGTVRIDGEEWTAENISGEEIPAGVRIRVVGVDGLRLQVERDWGAARWSERAPWPPDERPPEY
ncbi:MAG: NfeD family protein [Nitrososphaerales archaeon]